MNEQHLTTVARCGAGGSLVCTYRRRTRLEAGGGREGAGEVVRIADLHHRAVAVAVGLSRQACRLQSNTVATTARAGSGRGRDTS
jgi:hypothetical protein